eukprot:TRINITY_DN28870_c0_g1_i1.p1 TRINITY_DN28870_c0_g1~~TRINITY_DN28870_c0_g1_i1.p1  ORF type:complete len:637 (+),score=91.10 TRINITY_DN28870_c0_g1_i1:144-2054(+)
MEAQRIIKPWLVASILHKLSRQVGGAARVAQRSIARIEGWHAYLAIFSASDQLLLAIQEAIGVLESQDLTVEHSGPLPTSDVSHDVSQADVPDAAPSPPQSCSESSEPTEELLASLVEDRLACVGPVLEAQLRNALGKCIARIDHRIVLRRNVAAHVRNDTAALQISSLSPTELRRHQRGVRKKGGSRTTSSAANCKVPESDLGVELPCGEQFYFGEAEAATQTDLLEHQTVQQIAQELAAINHGIADLRHFFTACTRVPTDVGRDPGHGSAGISVVQKNLQHVTEYPPSTTEEQFFGPSRSLELQISKGGVRATSLLGPDALPHHDRSYLIGMCNALNLGVCDESTSQTATGNVDNQPQCAGASSGTDAGSLVFENLQSTRALPNSTMRVQSSCLNGLGNAQNLGECDECTSQPADGPIDQSVLQGCGMAVKPNNDSVQVDEASQPLGQRSATKKPAVKWADLAEFTFEIKHEHIPDSNEHVHKGSNELKGEPAFERKPSKPRRCPQWQFPRNPTVHPSGPGVKVESSDTAGVSKSDCSQKVHDRNKSPVEPSNCLSSPSLKHITELDQLQELHTQLMLYEAGINKPSSKQLAELAEAVLSKLRSKNCSKAAKHFGKNALNRLKALDPHLAFNSY